jgi:hypothetical protein
VSQVNLRAAVRKILRDNLGGPGDLVLGRIYPFPGPASMVRPALTYAVITNVRGRNTNGPDGTAEATVQIDAWCDTLDEAARLADMTAAVLDGYSGVTTGCRIIQANQDDERDSLDLEDDGSDELVCRLTMTYRVRYSTVSSP